MSFDRFYLEQYIEENFKGAVASALLAASLPIYTQGADIKPRIVKNDTVNDEILAATLVGEAASEGVKGMIAVMNVIANRARLQHIPLDQAYRVALQPMQFSMWNGKSNKSIETIQKAKQSKAWPIALKIVQKAKLGKLEDITDGATYYFNPKLAQPNWANKFVRTNTIGNHVFYKAPLTNKLAKPKKVHEEIDTPNNGFLDRPVGGPNLVNFSPNFKPAPGIFYKSDQTHNPSLTFTKIRAIKACRKLNRHADTLATPKKDWL